MKFLFETFIVILALLLILGLAYSVLSPMLEGLGVELDGIFNQSSPDGTNKSDDTTQVSETTAFICSHIYSEWEKMDSKYHQRLCKFCAFDESAKHSYEKTDEWLIKDAYDHYKPCDYCDYINYFDHLFDDDVCIYCGYEKPNESTDADTHEHAYTVYQSATEISHTYKCSCGLSKTTDHGFGDYTPIKDATCEEKGTEAAKCTVCEYEHKRDTSPLGHDYTNGVCTVCKAECLHYSYEITSETYCPAGPDGHITNSEKHCSICGLDFHTSIFNPHNLLLVVPGRCDYCDWTEGDGVVVENINSTFVFLSSNSHKSRNEFSCPTCNRTHLILGDEVPHNFNSNGKCSDCSYECSHLYSDGYCSICGVADPDYTPSAPDDACSHVEGAPTATGEYINIGDSTYHNVPVEVRCELCDELLQSYNETDFHEFVNGLCSYCGYPDPDDSGGDDVVPSCSHSETILNGDCCVGSMECLDCGETVSSWYGDEDGDGFCDSCGSEMYC